MLDLQINMKKYTPHILITIAVFCAFLFAQNAPQDNIPTPELGKKDRVYKTNPAPNLEGVKFQKIREKADHRYSQAHDALSIAYYEGIPFVWNGEDYGMLDQQTFSKLQAIIWAQYLVLFHEENMKLPEDDRYNESEYNIEYNDDGTVDSIVSEEAKKRIKEYKKNENLEITI